MILSFKKAPVYTGAFFFLCFFVYILVCWPALSGGFILDDWPNLSALEKVKNWPDIWAYSFSGTSGPMGRPLSYFSFALQANDWPDNSFPFKALNLVVHCINGLLCYVACYLYARHLHFNNKKTIVFAALCTFLWMFSPLHASTVFYVVQRMVLLASLFVWLGITGFLLGTLLELRGSPYAGRWIATISLALAYLLGMFSKESAVLLGVFVAVLYFVKVRGNFTSSQRWWDLWVIGVALMPVIVTAVYLCWGGRYLGSYSGREFSVEQRLYSEWRILWEYVSKIIFPTAVKINLLNDDFEFSKDLMNPLTTSLSGLAWLLLVMLGIAVRKKWPFILFGTLWFLGGHLLESTILGLELYFEHRNYLPSAGIIIAMVWGIFELWENVAQLQSRVMRVTGKVILFVVPGFYCVWFIGVLSNEAMSWQSQESFTLAAINDRPRSLRAHQVAASSMATEGDYLGSAMLLHKIDISWPDYPGTYAWLVFLHCVDGRVVMPAKQEVIERFKKGKFDHGTSDAFYEIYQAKRKGACEQLSWHAFRNYIHAVMSNENFPEYGLNDNLFRLEVFSYIEERDLQKVNALFENRNEKKMSISLLRLKMEMLSLSGREKETLSLIKRIKDRYRNNEKIWLINRHYFLDIENKIKDNLEAEKADEKREG